MKVNVGTLDRIVRVLLGAALIALALGYIGEGVPFRWIGWIGVIPLLTAAVGSCPLYSLVGLSTCPMKRA